MGNLLNVQLCEKCMSFSFNIVVNRDTVSSEGEIQNIKDKMDRLRAMKNYMNRRIKNNLDPQVERSHEVKVWLRQVAQLDNEVSKSGNRREKYVDYLVMQAVSLMDSIFIPRYRSDRTADSIFIPRHRSDRTADKNSIFQPRSRTADNTNDSIFITPSAEANIVGMEDMMSQVLRYLDDAKVRVVGIHGMGGAGKTTLAKLLIKKLRSSSSSPSTSAAGGKGSRKFDVIIWVVVSHDLDIRKLQEDIAVELGIHDSRKFKDKEESIRARFISSYLSERRFLLVLDDVWEKLDLKTIGIPELQENPGNKIVLTSRTEKVCIDMDAGGSIVKVGCLGQEDSWELFQKTIKLKDGEFEEKGVYEIARDIASKCGGLPLALITIARAMATKSDVDSWKYAKDELKVSPNEIRGMEDIYNLLQVSYNNLKNEEYKSCLLYSALFPEDSDIEINRMVDYCIGGGSVFVDGNMSCDIHRLRDHGRVIISELIHACLLERGTDEEYVKVHDAIRDMILNLIGRDSGSRIVSHAGKGLDGTYVVNVEEWGAASMLSFSRNYGMKKLAMEA